MDSDRIRILHDCHGRPEKRPSRLPAYLAIAYTLEVSLRFIASNLVGNGTIQRGDEVIADWIRKIFDAGDTTIRVRGLENVDDDGTYIYMSNHSSLLDIPAMFAAVPGSVRMIFKKELGRVPFWGEAMVQAGFIPIDRSDTKRAIEQLEVAKQRLRGGVSVWVAPEGTRSRTGELQSFKKGGFHLAIELGTPILPTYIVGTRESIPPDTFRCNYGQDVEVRFGKPIDTSDYSKETIEDLMARVREEIEALARLSGA